jgi:hypothetical protein
VTDGELERLDAPNQQVVRPDGSGPADEGSGGGKAPKPAPKPAAAKPGPKPKDTADTADGG